MPDSGTQTTSCRSATISPRFNEFRKNGQYCDVKLIAAEEEFDTHRNVLAAASPYFEAIFGGNFAEGQQLPCSIKVEQFDGPTIEAILEFLYSNEEIVIWDNEKKYWPQQSISRNFKAVSTELEFLQADKILVIDLISDDLLNAETEDEVFRAVLRWLRFDEEERAKDMAEVLQHVRLSLVNPAVVFDTFSTVDALKSSSCQDLLSVANQYHLLPSRRIEMLNQLSKRRRTSPEVEVIWMDPHSEFQYCVTEDGIEETTTQCTLPYESEHWNTFVCNYKSLQVHTSREKFSVYEQCNYYSKGHIRDQPLLTNFADYFNDCGACEMDGCWYLFGVGADEEDVSRFVLIYKVTMETWRSDTALPVAVKDPVAVTVEGEIYVLGGTDSKDVFCQQIQRYSPSTDTWTLMTPLSRVSGVDIGACAMKACIYVIFEDNREVHVYSVAKDEWNVDSSLLNHPFLSGPVMLNGQMYALTKPSDEKRVLEVFSPKSNSWRVHADFTNSKPDSIKGPLLCKRNTDETKKKVRMCLRPTK